MNADEVFKELGIPVAPSSHEHYRSSWLNFDCPYCSPGWRHYRMGFNTRGHYCSCWLCGRKPLFETLVIASGLEYHKVRDILGGLGPAARTKKIERKKLILPPGTGALQEPHIQYLKRRGFDHRELVKLWEIRGIGISSNLSWRIFIPIMFEGALVSWTTRSISNTVKERYISASADQESVDHKTILYGEDYCRHSIVVVEGPTDVWRIGPGAACTFGTAFSREQIARMVSYPVRVVCFDSSDDAQAKADKLCESLSVFPGETFNVKLNADDPGSATKEEIQKLRSRFLESEYARS